MSCEQPLVDRGRGLGGQLLEDDRAHQHREVVEAVADRAEAAGPCFLMMAARTGSRRIRARRATAKSGTSVVTLALAWCCTGLNCSSIAHHLCDLLVAQPGLAQHLARVLAEQRRATADGSGASRTS